MDMLLIKLCLVAFIGLGLFFVYEKISAKILLLGTGFLLALSYAIFANGMPTLLFGLTGDEVTIAAMFNTFAHVSFYSDFGYHHLPPFYPPLFFWVFGAIGRLFSFNGIQIAKLATTVSLAMLPYGMYWSAAKMWGRERFLILVPFFVFLLIDPSAYIGKPYELIAAWASVLWTIGLLLVIRKETFSAKTIAGYAITAGLIFMTYYLWLIFCAIAITLYGLTVPQEQQWTFYKRLAMVAVFSIIATLPYSAPLFIALRQYGSENWQSALFTYDEIAFPLTLSLALGFAALFYYRHNERVKILLALFASVYVWWLLALVTLLFFATPMQSFRGFDYFMPVIVACALAFAVEQSYNAWPAWTKTKRATLLLSVAAILISASQLFFGTFVDKDEVRSRHSQKQAFRPTIQTLIDELQAAPADDYPLTLISGIPEVSALVPINQFLYFNQHNNHPAAEFSGRLAYVESLSRATDAEMFAQLAQSSPYGAIERLILYRANNRYYLYYHVDDFGQGIQTKEISFPTSLVSDSSFTKTYSNDEFDIFVLQ